MRNTSLDVRRTWDMLFTTFLELLALLNINARLIRSQKAKPFCRALPSSQEVIFSRMFALLHSLSRNAL